jgi:hypothetical protein
MSDWELCDIRVRSIVLPLSFRRRVTSMSSDTVLALEWLGPFECCER